ncbi:MAG: DNA gyrase/topoisomerase IV subunit A, partial [Bacteroidales bacterium]|nr:DNA gyrase/topoisomerase IV subunit A [Bacteroidales bacterium]
MTEEINDSASSSPYRVQSIPGMFQNWFLDYASYVILERAVPEITDGLKPVQRRILHALYKLEDGRYNKVANVVGHTMQYHPHGDASIGDALVQLGQKNLLIDCQGNWGNILTGDSAAAPRYIEARLSKFALEVVFNPKTTIWKPSYDGRNQEPVVLPVKFPLLLAQGVEGIAVGLSTKVLPHNFRELLQASVAILKKEDFTLYPDFPTGGLMDVTNYQDGRRGGKVRVRARISQADKKTLVIEDIPYGETTVSVIDSILKANDKGKIKIRKIEDNTAENVEIVVHLQPGVSPDTTIDALYAFTNCEVSISPNACVITDGAPAFMDVKEILRSSTADTVELLKQELQIRQEELESDWHYTSLEKIFFEERIYRELEKDAKKWEDLLKGIEKAFKPFESRLRRAVTREDVVRLTEKPVRKISKFDVKKADTHIKELEAEMKVVAHKLSHLTDYAIEYFEHILEKYGEGRERKTEIRSFEVIQAARVAATNQKLYVNCEEGFVGTGMKKDEYVCECSDLDDIIVFRQDGNFMVTKVADKVFVGKDILHVGVFERNDERTIYNMAYHDGKSGFAYVKRFAIGGVTRDKDYLLTQGTPGTKILYFTANPNGEAEVVKVYLKPKPKLKKLQFEFDFKTLAVKGRGSMGNI